jgi:hypothetical protein
MMAMDLSNFPVSFINFPMGGTPAYGAPQRKKSIIAS